MIYRLVIAQLAKLNEPNAVNVESDVKKEQEAEREREKEKEKKRKR